MILAMASRSFRVVVLVVATHLAASQAHAQNLLIENATVIDGTGSTPLRNTSVMVIDGRISDVGEVPRKLPPGTTRVDASNKFLIPGLIDTHIHLAGGRRGMVTQNETALTMDFDTGIATLHGYLYSGVTSVYDSGNHNNFIFRLRDDERSGKIVSPRIFATGSVVSFAGGYASGEGATALSGWDDIDKLDAHLARNPDMVKFVLDPRGFVAFPLSPTFSPDLLQRLIEYCKARGFRTTSHVASEDQARVAVEAGVDSLAHVVTRSRINPSFAELAASRGIPISTTMTVFTNIARVVDDPAMFDTPLFVATLDARERERQKTHERERYIRSGMAATFGLLIPYMQENIRVLYGAGTVLAAGTDRTFGPTLHQELSYLVESGVTPSDAIRIATLNAATYLGKEDELGSITPGKLADMVLLSADPTMDIANAQAIEAVYKGGQRVQREKLRLPINEPE